MQYSELSDRELLDLSSKQGDKLATVELLNRQRAGRAVRLYAEPRKGPNDEGVTPWAMAIEDGIVTLHSGLPNRPLILQQGDVRRWMMSAVYKTRETCLQAMAVADGNAAVALKALQERATPEFDCESEANEQRQVIQVTLLPAGLVTWRLGVEEARKFVREALKAAAALGWTNDELGFTREETDLVVLLVSPLSTKRSSP